MIIKKLTPLSHAVPDYFVVLFYPPQASAYLADDRLRSHCTPLLRRSPRGIKKSKKKRQKKTLKTTWKKSKEGQALPLKKKEKRKKGKK